MSCGMHMGEEIVAQYKSSEKVNNHVKILEQGATTTVWTAVSKYREGHGGKYLGNCQVSVPV